MADGSDILMGMDAFYSNNQMALNTEAHTKTLFACKDGNISRRYHVEGTYDGRMSLPLMIAMLVLGFITFFVNLGVIIRTIKILRHDHDSKPSFYFIGNLALSDLAIGLYIVIAFLLHISSKSNLWEHKACTLQIGVAVTACQETIFTIMLIAVDKYLYICHALKYHQIVTIKRVYATVITSWVISFIIGSLPALGMHVHWDDTCGRCIFAEVVSKDFAILMFITAVILPYTVIVSLYTILLLLAIKMQRAKYGGNVKVSNQDGKSKFRLTFVSRTPTGFAKSRTSTTKSDTSRKTVSTTASTNSGASISKSKKRRQRKEAMQEYKASLPQYIKEHTEKLINTNNAETPSTQNQNLSGKEGEASEALRKDNVKKQDERIIYSQDSISCDSERDESGSSRDHSRNGAMLLPSTIHCDLKYEKAMDTSLHEKYEDCQLEVGENVSELSNKNSQSVNTSGTSETTENEKVNGAALEVDANEDHDNETLEDIQNNTLPPSETHKLPGLREESMPKRISEISSSDSHISSQNIPPLESTDEEEVSELENAKKWNLSAYLSRVVSDTKDKVQFLKKCQAVKTVFLIVGSFTATYVPFVIGSLVYSIQKEKNKKLLHILQTLLYCVVVANSLANPLMYAYGYREFRIKTEKFKGVFATKKKPKL